VGPFVVSRTVAKAGMHPDSVIGAAKDEERRRLLGGVLFGPSFANRIREICKKPLGGTGGI
jgi:hypothetical protein